MNKTLNITNIATVLILTIVSAVIFLPELASAQTLLWFEELIQQADNIIRVIVIPLLIGLALLLFVWGVIKYFIYGADDESNRTTGRAYMLYGLLGLAAIVAVWGFVNLLLQILGVKADVAPTVNGYLP